MPKQNPKIAVIGAGVVGMTVANLLQDRLKHAEITILAEKFKEDTTSAVAAGIFRPGTSFKGPTKEITKKWIHDSWHHWNEILRSPDAVDAGVIPLSGYIFSKDNYHVTKNHLIEDLLPVYRPCQPNELKICGEGWKYGSFFTTAKIECDKYLPWMEKKFLGRGGKIVDIKIESLTLLPQKYDLVFNCSGFGAKVLSDDHDLVPLRGQVIKVRAPWLKTAFYGDYDTYIIPGMDGLATLGGVRQYDSYNLEACKHDGAAIWERCCELLPRLKEAEVLGHKVGLRPHRVPVRVEGEVVGGVKVVHCYGHGGYGVTCAPGTAIHAVDIGLEMLKVNNKL